MEPKRICLFVRVSTEKQDYERQLYELRNYCEEKNYKISKVIETTISGCKINKSRPDIQELLESAKKDQFDKVLVTEASRLGRIAKEFRHVIDTLHSFNKSVIFKNYGFESLDDNGKESFVANIFMLFMSELAQEEKRQLSDRIKSGLRHAVDNNGKVLGRPSYQKETPERFKGKYPEVTSEIIKLSINKSLEAHPSISRMTMVKLRKVYKKEMEAQK